VFCYQERKDMETDIDEILTYELGKAEFEARLETR
jgi:hypothetical protein